MKSCIFVCPQCKNEFILSGAKLSKVMMKKRLQGNLYQPCCSSECTTRYYRSFKSLEPYRKIEDQNFATNLFINNLIIYIDS